MENIIEITRKLGAAIQESEAYKNYQAALEANEKDEELNKLIGEFNMLRVSVGNEASKDNRDEEKVASLNNELRECYDKIMNNEKMQAFEAAKNELDHIMTKVQGIISLSIEGEDPATCEVPDACSGSCSTCGGCH